MRGPRTELGQLWRHVCFLLPPGVITLQRSGPCSYWLWQIFGFRRARLFVPVWALQLSSHTDQSHGTGHILPLTQSTTNWPHSILFPAIQSCNKYALNARLAQHPGDTGLKRVPALVQRGVQQKGSERILLHHSCDRCDRECPGL